MHIDVPERTNRGRGSVVSACGGSRAEQHEIAFVYGLPQRLLDPLWIVRHDRIDHASRTPTGKHRAEDCGVKLRYFAFTRCFAERYNLVSRGDDGDARLCQNAELLHAAREQGTDQSGLNLDIGRQYHISGGDVFPDLAHMLPGSRRRAKQYFPVFLHAILDHHHRVTVPWQWIAGVHANKLTLTE